MTWQQRSNTTKKHGSQIESGTGPRGLSGWSVLCPRCWHILARCFAGSKISCGPLLTLPASPTFAVFILIFVPRLRRALCRSRREAGRRFSLRLRRTCQAAVWLQELAEERRRRFAAFVIDGTLVAVSFGGIPHAALASVAAAGPHSLRVRQGLQFDRASIYAEFVAEELLRAKAARRRGWHQAVFSPQSCRRTLPFGRAHGRLGEAPCRCPESDPRGVARVAARPRVASFGDAEGYDGSRYPSHKDWTLKAEVSVAALWDSAPMWLAQAAASATFRFLTSCKTISMRSENARQIHEPYVYTIVAPYLGPIARTRGR